MQEKVENLDRKQFEEFLGLLKLFVYLWENSNKHKTLFALQCETFKKDLRLFNTFKEYQRVCKYNSSSLKAEEESIANLILSEFFIKTKRWLNSDLSFPYESFPSIADRMLRHEIAIIRNIRKIEDSNNAFNRTSNPDFLNKVDTAKTRQVTDSLLSIEALRERRANEKIIKEGKLIKNFLDNIRKEVHSKKKGYKELNKLEEHFKKILSDSYQKDLEKYTKSKSVYEIAKLTKIDDYRKLLYTLRKISFPLITFSDNREGNYITHDSLEFFMDILPEIRQIWSQEKNFKDWICYLKKKFGWSKSYISKFMSRRIEKGNVPVLFFEIFPPPPSNKLMNNLLKRSIQLNAFFELFPSCKKNNSYRNRLKTLKIQMRKARKTFLGTC